MEISGDTIKKNVNSIDRSISTVNSNTVEEKINVILEEANIKPEGIGLMLAEGLDDKRSLTYYILLAKEANSTILLETLHYVKSIAREKIIHNKPAYFLGILRKKGIKVKFRKENE